MDREELKKLKDESLTLREKMEMLHADVDDIKCQLTEYIATEDGAGRGSLWLAKAQKALAIKKRQYGKLRIDYDRINARIKAINHDERDQVNRIFMDYLKKELRQHMGTVEYEDWQAETLEKIRQFIDSQKEQ